MTARKRPGPRSQEEEGDETEQVEVPVEQEQVPVEPEPTTVESVEPGQEPVPSDSVPAPTPEQVPPLPEPTPEGVTPYPSGPTGSGMVYFLPTSNTSGTTTESGASFALASGVPVKMTAADAAALTAEGLGSIKGD